MTYLAAPQVDPTSRNGDIVVAHAFLKNRFAGAPNEILRAHYTGESVSSPKVYWFEDCPEVRRELGMEVMKSREIGEVEG
jgi:hypothetical protein